MRIAEISTLFDSVPPRRESSVERVVGLLTEGLARKGHEVTLYARRDSRASASLRSPVARGYTEDPAKWDWQLYEMYQVREAFRAWRDFDVIHCHSYYFGLLFAEWVGISSLHSFHIEPGPDYRFLAERTEKAHLHFCSEYQRRDFAGHLRTHVVPHGLDLARYRVREDESASPYLAWMGRFIPGKGPLEAIEVARLAGMPLKLAAPHNEYYEETVRRHVDGRSVEYVGELHDEAKAAFLSKAHALLYPVQYGEPFGLVLVEALASGTPVIAMDRGAVPEIVRNGVSGWLGDSIESLAAGVDGVASLDRAAIRRYAEAEFSAQRMVDGIESILRQLAEGRKD